MFYSKIRFRFLVGNPPRKVLVVLFNKWTIKPCAESTCPFMVGGYDQIEGDDEKDDEICRDEDDENMMIAMTV